jgi:putative hydrolase of the HAD superfamily
VGLRALIFDYFGTLTVSASVAQRRSGVTRVAAALGVRADLLFDTISSTFTERATGECGDMLATMAWLAHRCGYQPSAAQLETACEVRTEVEGQYARALRDDALTTLGWLRRHGLRVGVVSDCTHELPALWSSLPVAGLVDAAVFSVLIGHRKPHASLYQRVCHQLGVAPSEALYVGDGGSNELSGAIAAGIPAIRLVTADAAAALVYDAEPTWTGPVIHSLTALTALTQGALADFAHDVGADPPRAP